MFKRFIDQSTTVLFVYIEGKVQVLPWKLPNSSSNSPPFTLAQGLHLIRLQGCHIKPPLTASNSDGFRKPSLFLKLRAKKLRFISLHSEDWRMFSVDILHNGCLLHVLYGLLLHEHRTECLILITHACPLPYGESQLVLMEHSVKRDVNLFSYDATWQMPEEGFVGSCRIQSRALATVLLLYWGILQNMAVLQDCSLHNTIHYLASQKTWAPFLACFLWSYPANDGWLQAVPLDWGLNWFSL